MELENTIKSHEIQTEKRQKEQKKKRKKTPLPLNLVGPRAWEAVD